MLKGIDIDQRIEYVSVEDDSDPKTIFIFKPLSSEDMLEFVTNQDGGQFKLQGKKIFEFLELTICEIKNYKLSDVKESLKTLPPLIIAELVQEAGKINKMTEQDKKN